MVAQLFSPDKKQDEKETTTKFWSEQSLFLIWFMQLWVIFLYTLETSPYLQYKTIKILDLPWVIVHMYHLPSRYIRNITLPVAQIYWNLGSPLNQPVQSTKGMFNMVSNSTRHILSGSHDGFKKDCLLTVTCRKYWLLTVTCRKDCLLTKTCRSIKALRCGRNSRNLIGVCYCQEQRELCWF